MTANDEKTIGETPLPFERKVEFNRTVLSVKAKTSLSWIDAVMETCEIMDIEPEVAGKMCDRSLKENIEQEAIEKNFLKHRKKKRSKTIPMQEI